MLNRQSTTTVRQGDVGRANLLARCGQRQRRADDIENAAGVTKAGIDRDSGEDALVSADNNDVPPGRDAPGGDEAGQQKLQAIECRRMILSG